jgi:hypothetical protein
MDRDEETARIQCKLFYFFIFFLSFWKLSFVFYCTFNNFYCWSENNLRIDYEGLVLILVFSLISTRVFFM